MPDFACAPDLLMQLFGMTQKSESAASAALATAFVPNHDETNFAEMHFTHAEQDSPGSVTGYFGVPIVKTSSFPESTDDMIMHSTDSVKPTIFTEVSEVSRPVGWRTFGKLNQKWQTEWRNFGLTVRF